MIRTVVQHRDGLALLADAVLALVETALVTSLAWGDNFFGDPIEGPAAVRVVLPLLMGVPLVIRRRAPLLVWCLGALGICLQAVSSHHSAEGLETLVVLCVGPYTVAAYGRARSAVAGLALLVPTYLVFAGEDANYRSGRLNEVWATFFFGLLALSAWLAGLAVRHVRQTRLAAARALEHEQERRRAVLEERARIARELHDIVTHQLSVVVLQASGARARGGDDVLESTLAKIETSGRNALAEMRRMLGVLRASADDASLAPPPGLDDIPALVAGVRDAGLPVDLHMDRTTGVPTSVGLSAYRIVQESLTNTIKHAAASRADVVIRQTSSALEVEVHDDSSTPPGAVTPGHGLTGMRERATMLGGDLIAGWDRSGFLVRAVLPLAVAP